MKYVTIVDNRLPVNYDGFEMESVYASIHKNIFEMLASFQVIAEQNQNWLGNISNISIASSPITCRLISKVDIGPLFEALSFRFTASATAQLWSYLMDGLHKIISQLKSNSSSNKAGLIILIITDLSFYNDQSLDPDDASFGSVCAAISKLMSDSYTIRIICIQTKLLHLIQDPSRELDLRRLELKLQSIKQTCLDQFSAPQRKAMEDQFGISIIDNNPIYFEEELKAMVQYAMSTVSHCTLSFAVPGSGSNAESSGMKLSVSYSVQPISIDSMRSLHAGMQTPEIYSIIPRQQLHPACIKGNTLLVTPTEDSQSPAQAQTRMAYTALVTLLAQRDWLLILRVRHPVHLHCEYWCLIPPPASSCPADTSSSSSLGAGTVPAQEQLFMLQLLDNESLINYTLTSGSQGSIPHSGNSPSHHIPAVPTPGGISAEDMQELGAYLRQFMEQALEPWSPGAAATEDGAGGGGSGAFYNPLVAVSGSIHRKVPH